MKKNVAGQVVVAQLIKIADGLPMTTGTTTVYVLGNGGTQAAGTVGLGACTHEGNGVWSYEPDQTETDFDHVAFTFVNVGSVNPTIQIYTSFPQSADAVTSMWATIMEGSHTARDFMRGFAATLLGKASGMSTTTAVFRDIDDTKDRVTATVDSDGNRSAVTTDLT